LEEYKQEQFDWVENDLMLPYKDGTPNGDKRVPQQIRNIFDRAGIKGSSHTLRHTCITNWLNSVSNIKLVSTLAGHSAISITLDRYGHVLEENAISEMDNLYSTMRGLDVKKV
jgi:integrase